MRFRNGKKKIGLIALLSCVFTATVAFAAYTGYNYINGTVDVLAAPVEMVFADNAGNEVDTFSAADHAAITGYATASDLTVTTNAEGMQTINDLHVGLSAAGDQVIYTFNVKNNGLGTAYLTGIEIAEWVLNGGVSGVTYLVQVGEDSIYSTDGSAATLDSCTISVEPGEWRSVVLRVDATDNFTVPGDYDRSATDEDFFLGEVKLTWEDTDPNA